MAQERLVMRTPLQDALSEGVLDVASVFEELDSVLEAVDIVADSLLTVCRVGIESDAYSAPFQGTNPEIEKQVLKNQADALESELESIKKRLAQFDRSSTDD